VAESTTAHYCTAAENIRSFASRGSISVATQAAIQFLSPTPKPVRQRVYALFFLHTLT